MSYADNTGNVLVMVSEPGLAIRGAARRAIRNHARKPVNLRGPRAWAVERTLAEVLPPYGLTELAAETLEVDAGYLSRLLTGLADELLIERQPRQPIQRVDWEAMIRQITSTY